MAKKDDNSGLPADPSAPVPNKQRLKEDRFREFHAKYPFIFTMFKKAAERYLEAGNTSFSADGLMHVIRFNYHCQFGPEGRMMTISKVRVKVGLPKVNDHIVPYYATKLRDEDPRFAKFFRVMKRRS